MQLLDLMESEQRKLHALVNVLEKLIFTLILHLKLATLLDFHDVLNHLNTFHSSNLEIVTLQFKRQLQISHI